MWGRAVQAVQAVQAVLLQLPWVWGPKQNTNNTEVGASVWRFLLEKCMYVGAGKAA